MKAKKACTDQSTLQVFLLSPNRNSSQTFKRNSWEKILLQSVCYRWNLLRWIFLIPCDKWRTLFFLKACRYFKIFSTAIFLLSLKQVFWKKSLFYIISTITLKKVLILYYLHNNNTVLIPKSQNVAIVYYTFLPYKLSQLN